MPTVTPHHYNNLVLHKYIWFARFESKLAAYTSERLADEKEEIFEYLQYVFVRDLTSKEYCNFLNTTCKYGINTIRAAEGATNKKDPNRAKIKSLYTDALGKVSVNNYEAANEDLEEVFLLCIDSINTIESVEFNPSMPASPLRIKMSDFAYEYQILFDCMVLNADINDRLIASRFGNCIVDSTTTLHEIHQGFTHLTRHINHIVSSSNKEVERFKSHIHRASLDFLKITIESMVCYFDSTVNKDALAWIRLESSKIKDKEVFQIPSAQMHPLYLEYKEIIDIASKML